MIEFLGVIVTVLGAIYALEARELMRGVLGLSFFFLGISILFSSMGAWFLAVGQIFLFVGGVVTLFVFAFSYTETPVQKTHFITATSIAVVVAVLLYEYLNVQPAIQPVSMRAFTSFFFSQYGFILNIAFLILFSAVMTAQYVMTEEKK